MGFLLGSLVLGGFLSYRVKKLKLSGSHLKKRCNENLRLYTEFEFTEDNNNEIEYTGSHFSLPYDVILQIYSRDLRFGETTVHQCSASKVRACLKSTGTCISDILLEVLGEHFRPLL